MTMNESRNDTTFLNYVQRFDFSVVDPYVEAIVGRTKPTHPRLARLLRFPFRLIHWLSAQAMWMAGIKEEECENGECGVVGTETGFEWVNSRLGDLFGDWTITHPIYDETRVAAIKKRLAEEAVSRPEVFRGSSVIARDATR